LQGRLWLGYWPGDLPIPSRTTILQAGLTLQALAGKVEGANKAFALGTIRQDGKQIELAAGETLQGLDQIANLLVTIRSL
jgi:multidrug efflux pump subunit AcrB